MPSPMVTFINSTEIKVSWSNETFHLGAPTIQRYEVKIVSQDTSEEVFFKDDIPGHLTSIDAILNNAPDCNNMSMTHLLNVTIRSWTRDKSEEFVSPLSPVEVISAYCGGKCIHVQLNVWKGRLLFYLTNLGQFLPIWLQCTVENVANSTLSGNVV